MGERDFECSGSMQVKKTATLIISEGSTILGGPMELHLIDQRCQAGLLCGEASATTFCQRLSCDFRYQALSRFSSQVKKVERGLGTRLYSTSIVFVC